MPEEMVLSDKKGLHPYHVGLMSSQSGVDSQTMTTWMVVEETIEHVQSYTL